MKVITLSAGSRYVPILSIFKYVEGPFAVEKHYRMTYRQVGAEFEKHVRLEIGSPDLAKAVGAYVMGFVPFWDVIAKRVVYADDEVFDEVVRFANNDRAETYVGVLNRVDSWVRVVKRPTRKGMSVELSAQPIMVMGGKLFFAVDKPERYVVDNVVIMRAVKVGFIVNSRTGKKTRIFVGVPT